MSEIAQLSPGSLNFGNQRVNTSSASQNVTLLNTGDGRLALSTIFTTRPHSQTNTYGSSIAPGTYCNISVVFAPTVRGTINQNVKHHGKSAGNASSNGSCRSSALIYPPKGLSLLVTWTKNAPSVEVAFCVVR